MKLSRASSYAIHALAHRAEQGENHAVASADDDQDPEGDEDLDDDDLDDDDEADDLDDDDLDLDDDDEDDDDDLDDDDE